MPVVPFVPRPQSQQDYSLPGQAPDEMFTMMAAADMHQNGRLVQVADTRQQHLDTLPSWGEGKVTGALISNRSLDIYTDKSVKEQITALKDPLFDGANLGMSIEKGAAYDRFKHVINELDPKEFEVLDGKNMVHVRRMPRVW